MGISLSTISTTVAILTSVVLLVDKAVDVYDKKKEKEENGQKKMKTMSILISKKKIAKRMKKTKY